MKRITFLIFTIILIISISGCAGYKPIFQSTNLQFKITNHAIEGNKVLGNKIYSNLRNLTKSLPDDQNIKNIDILISISKDKSATSKNSAGKILEYKILISAKIIVIDSIASNQILNQTFISSSTYKVQDQYSETVKLENKSTEDLINKINQELLIQLSQSI